MKSQRKKWTIYGETYLECKDCKELKPKSKFYIDSPYKVPRTACKECECKRGRKRYETEKFRARVEKLNNWKIKMMGWNDLTMRTFSK